MQKTKMPRVSWQILIVIYPILSFATNALSGPIIVGGDDLTDHGSFSSGSGNQRGWLYIQRAVENIIPQVTRFGNDGSIAVLGSQPSAATSGDAGAAIGRAADAAAATLNKVIAVNYYNGASMIEEFFTQLNNGDLNPAMIWIPGTGAANDLESDEGAKLTDHAQTIAVFVNSGGGLLAHGSGNIAYGWLTTLISGLQEQTGCTANGAALTSDGHTAFPGLSNSDINNTAGPCHSHFEGDFGALKILATDGAGRAFMLGGSETTIPKQITLSPITAENFIGATHTVTATVTQGSGSSTPLPNVMITFTVTAGPNAGDTEIVGTNESGMASFTYIGDGGSGTDSITAQITDAPDSDPVTVCWAAKGDVDCDGIINSNDSSQLLQNLVSGKLTTLGRISQEDDDVNNLDAFLIDAFLAGVISEL